MSAKTLTLHEKLKKETDSSHRQLEKALNLMRPDLVLPDYINLLKAFYGFYLPLEKKLSSPIKTLWLEEDLKYFDVPLESIPLCEKIPNHNDESYKFGISYVLEGSNLGALVLTKHFGKILNLSSNNGLRFFSGHGNLTMDNWKDFLKRLQIFSESKNCREDLIISGANDTFSLLHSWLVR